MNMRFFKCAIFGILLFIVSAQRLKAQSDNYDCLDEKFENKCYSQIKSIFDDYIFLKSRPFASSLSTDVEFSVPLRRNVLYIFNVCQNSGGKNSMVLSIYDNNDKLMVTSVDSKTNKNTRIIAFKPEEAGKYYLKTSFENNENGCCLILLGMIVKNIEGYIPQAKK